MLSLRNHFYVLESVLNNKTGTKSHLEVDHSIQNSFYVFDNWNKQDKQEQNWLFNFSFSFISQSLHFLYLPALSFIQCLGGNHEICTEINGIFTVFKNSNLDFFVFWTYYVLLLLTYFWNYCLETFTNTILHCKYTFSCLTYSDVDQKFEKTC